MTTASSITLKRLGVSRRECSVLNFPTTINPEFLEPWAHFIGTQSCTDLFNSKRDTADGMLEVVMAFVSHLQAAGAPASKIFIKNAPINPQQHSRNAAEKELCALLDTELLTPLTQRSVLRSFKPKRVNIIPSYMLNEVVGGFVPQHLDLYVSVSLAKGLPQRLSDMNAVMKSGSMYMFSKMQVPKKLLSPTDIPALINAPWPTVEKLPELPSRWVALGDEFSVARAEGNVLVFRKRVYPKTVVYSNGRNIASVFKSFAKKLTEKALRA